MTNIYESNVENPLKFKGKSRMRLSNGALNVPGFGPPRSHCFFRPTSICQMPHSCPHQSFLAYTPLYFCTNDIPIFHFAKIFFHYWNNTYHYTRKIPHRSHHLKRKISNHPFSKGIEKEQPYLIAFRCFLWLVF